MSLFSRKKQPTIPHEALGFWVHRRNYLELLRRGAIRKGLEPFPVSHLGDSFAFTTALVTSDGPLPVTASHLERLGLTGDEARTQALRNVAAAFQNAEVAEGLVLFHVDAEIAGCGLLIPDVLFPKLPLKGSPVAMLPHSRLLLLAGDRDESALARMLDLAAKEFESAKDWRALDAVRFEGSAFVPDDWLPPRSHPLRGTFRSLRSRSYARVAPECLLVEEEDPPPLAHLAALPPERGGGLIAGWARETSVVIPDETERIVLLDTPDGPPDRVDVAFETLRDVLPTVFVPVGEYEAGEEGEAGVEEGELEEAPFWRTRGSWFPSARAKAFLIARSAHDAAHPGAREREVPAAELLAAWDAGASILIDPAEHGNVVLRAPDRRRATIPWAEVRQRVMTLPEADQRHVFFQAAVNADRPAAWLEGFVELIALAERSVDANQTARTALFSSELPKKILAELAGDPNAPEGAQELAAVRSLMYEPTRLYPILRPPGHREAMMANVRGQLAQLSPAAGAPVQVDVPGRAAVPFQQGIEVEVVADDGNRMIVLDASFPPEDLESARATALLNLAAASLAPWIRMKTPGAFEGPWRDGYAASRLLVPWVFAAEAVQGERLVFAPHVNRVWMVGAEDAAGMAAVLDAIDAFLTQGEATTPYGWREWLLARPWVLRAGAVHPWEPPASHPLAGRIAALETELERRRKASAANAGAFAQAARYVAPESKA